MEFETIYNKFSVIINKLAKKSRGYSNFVNEEDISQEMRIHLWEEYENGNISDKTDSYIIQGLWFCSKNYLRKKIDRGVLVSLDEPVDDNGATLKDIVPDNSSSFIEKMESKMLIQELRGNAGLTEREKEVLDLCLDGYDLREIGKKIGVSYVRVFKIKKNILKKNSFENVKN